ncbi:MAG: hypothetical protein WDO19_09765 [Bacteroidota bacterium]
MKKIISLFLLTSIYYTAYSQILAGASIGTFNIPGAADKFKGIGPTIKVEYSMSGETSAYLDASLYNKQETKGTTTITDADGALIGEADTKARYSIKHVQLGLKRLFGRGFDEKGFSFFLGGGAAASFVKTTFKYTLQGNNIPDSKYNDIIFGFHFNTGFQYNFNFVILELKANFDIMTKPLVSGDSYIMSASRIGILIPLTKE